MGMILSGEITSALTTFAGLGLALILEGDGAERVRLGWTDAAEPTATTTRPSRLLFMSTPRHARFREAGLTAIFKPRLGTEIAPSSVRG